MIRDEGSTVIEAGARIGDLARRVAEERGEPVVPWAAMESNAILYRVIQRFLPEGAWPILGPADTAMAWSFARQAIGGAASLVTFLGSSIYELPHDRQVAALQLAGASLRPGGRLILRAFVPAPWSETSGRMERFQEPTKMPEPFNWMGWGCRTIYDIDRAGRQTTAYRTFGPAGEGEALIREMEHRVEYIHWRRPAEFPTMIDRAGLVLDGMANDGSWLTLTASAP